MNIKTNIICTCWILITTVIMSGCSQIESGDKVTVGKSSRNLGNANVKMVGDRLTVGTGVVERQWKWTKKGFVTVSFTETKSAKEWADQAPALDCDWEIPAVIDGNTEAKLLGVTARKADDEGFDEADKSDDYLSARFDNLKVEAKKSDSNKTKQGKKVVGDGSGHEDADDMDPDKAREKMIARQDGTDKKGKDKKD